MDGYAQGSRELGSEGFQQNLDFSAESIDNLDEILVLVSESPDLDLDFEVRLWGSYLGEVLRRRYNGIWEMTHIPGALSPYPPSTCAARGCFPLIKVYRRLTMGEEEDLPSFFAMVTERLGSPARVN